jgi:DNA adenine methylase
MSGNTRKLIAFNYFGGKFTYVEQLEKLFPKHRHFIDVFCGSMAVTLNKKPSEIDTANDINGDVINFFKVLRESPDELITLLELTPIAREEYNQAFYQKDNDSLSELERARAFYVRVRQSFYGLGSQRQNKGWHAVKTISRARRPETVSKWKNAIEKLDPVFERLLNIQIESRDFRTIIPVMDFEEAFFYCDPPYPTDCRGSKNDYAFDFTNQDHEELAEMRNGVKGNVMLSSYVSPLPEKLYKGWYQVRFEKKLNNIRTKPVQECVWLNYNPSMATGQLSLI